MSQIAGGSQGSLRLLAPAKVNLCLHVTSRREDGYHTLDSLVVFAGVGDELTATPADDISLDISGAQAGILHADTAENLIISAARRFQDLTGTKAGVHFDLVKNLPVASGIGGGSSDAAAGIRLLEDLWSAHLPTAQLADLLVGLGADVPMCHLAQPAFASGIGEELRPLTRLPKACIVLANPLIEVPTGAIFKRLDGFADPVAPDGLDDLQSFDDLIAFLKQCLNSLEAPAIEVEPVIADVLSEMSGLPGCALARMSGSGATCFGLFSNQGQAAAAASALRANYPDWWIEQGPVLSDQPAIKTLTS